MLRLASADWLRIRKYWLPWVLLALLIVIPALQVNGKLDELLSSHVLIINYNLSLTIRDLVTKPDDGALTEVSEYFAASQLRHQYEKS